MTSARFHRLTYRPLALALAGLALTSTFAQGASDPGQISVKPAADPGIYVHPDHAAPAAARRAARADLATASAPLEPRPAADDASSAGFDWFAAAIGAAAGSLLVAFVVAGPLGVGRRGRHAART